MKNHFWVFLPTLVLGVAWAETPKLFVYYPSLVRPLVIQDALAKRCPTLEITVFGRQTDFHIKIQSEAPEAILAQAAVLESFPAYSPVLQGLRKGKTWEPYVFLSLETGVDLDGLSKQTIGMVGILERKALTGLVRSLAGHSPGITRVTKAEDLLPLLTFQTVKAIFTSREIVGEFMEKSRAALIVTEAAQARMGLITLGVREGAGLDKLIEAMKKLMPEEMSLLGVDTWK